MSDEPRFDDPTPIYIDGDKRRELVIHRGPDCVPICWHSPLTDGSIKCTICEDGARVHLRDDGFFFSLSAHNEDQGRL